MWLAEVSDTEIEPGEQVIVTLWVLMEAEAPFVALGSTKIDAANIGGGELGFVFTLESLHDLGGLCPGCGPAQVLDDGTIEGWHASQLTVFGPFVSDNPIDVFTFTWEAEAPCEVAYTTQTQYANMWVGEDQRSAGDVAAKVIHEAEFGWTVIGCEADVNGDVVLNVLDFVAFQQAWVRQEAIGDCDGNGVYDVIDFVCFQSLFVAGCE
jgi:hypothetical protein